MIVEYGNGNFDNAAIQRLPFLIDPPYYRILRHEI